MYDRGVLVITIKLDYSKVPSTGTAVHLRSTVPTTTRFPENKTELILIFNPKFTLGLIFGECLILIYQKMKLQSKN